MKRSFLRGSRLALAPLFLLIMLVSPLFAQWDEGVAAFQAREFKAAVSHFEHLVEQQPEKYHGHYMLGLSLGAAGKKSEALEHLNAAYDLNPNDVGLKAAIDKLSKLTGKELRRISAELGAGLIAEHSKKR